MPKTINHLYDGKVDLVFESAYHRYTYLGNKVQSVTGVLGIINKPFLINWAAKMTTEKMTELFLPGVSYDEVQIKTMLDTAKSAHYKAKTEAGDVGTLVHHYIEQVIKGEHPGLLVHEEARNAAQRFMDWVSENDVEFLLSEQVVFSKKFNYCGTLDFVCRIHGKLMLGDIKTSNAIYHTEMGGQMAAYKIAREEEFPDEHYDGCVLVRVGKKDAEFETWQIDNTKPYEAIFLSALKLGNAIAKVEPKK